MTVEEAVAARVSRRSYLPKPLTPAEQARLQRRIDLIQVVSGVRFVLVSDAGRVFSRFGKGYGLFSGVRAFLALIARTDEAHSQEKLGFCGELLVLEATAMGLGTCWVGGTFDRAGCPCDLAANEELTCVITLGNCREKEGAKEALIHRFMRRGTKDIEELYDSVTDAPPAAWFLEGMQSVRRAPSAYNRQPVRLTYDGRSVTASVPQMGDYHALDLGIAKAHFAIVTGGRWDWGSGGRLHKHARGHYRMALGKAIDSVLAQQFPPVGALSEDIK